MFNAFFSILTGGGRRNKLGTLTTQSKSICTQVSVLDVIGRPHPHNIQAAHEWLWDVHHVLDWEPGRWCARKLAGCLQEHQPDTRCPLLGDEEQFKQQEHRVPGLPGREFPHSRHHPLPQWSAALHCSAGRLPVLHHQQQPCCDQEVHP